MRFKRVPFPRYLNRPKLWLLFETDELKFVAIIDGITAFTLFMISVPPYIFVFFLTVSSYFSLKLYREIRKKLSSSNAIDFFFYELGISQPKKLHKKDVEIPYGFIKKLID
ncbi:hypothetical protein [Caminibacter sp.]